MISGIKNTCWLLLICCSVLKIEAQAPGYMGKRFSAGYGIYINPAFNSIARGYSDKAINTSHEIFLEYALGKKFSVGLAGQFFRYRYNTKDVLELEDYSNSVFSYNGNYQRMSGNYLLKGRNYKLYGKFFKDRYLAPWGKYFILGLTFNSRVATYDPDEMGIAGQTYVQSYATGKYVYQDFFFNEFGPTTQKFRSVDLFFGNGNSRIIANKITLDYGYTIGCIAMTQMFIDAIGFEKTTPDNYIETTSRTRAAAINRFNFFLKIGYLF